ncbi:hypothetical protein HDZ31DRAFT_67158 [Schizophyllum fasciatum]
MTSTTPASVMDSTAQPTPTSLASQQTPSQPSTIAAHGQQQSHPAPMTPPKSPVPSSPRTVRVAGAAVLGENREIGAGPTSPLVELEEGEVATEASPNGEASDSDTDVEILMHSVGRMGLPDPGEDGGDNLPTQRPDVSPILPLSHVDPQPQKQDHASHTKPQSSIASSLSPAMAGNPSSDFASNAAPGAVSSVLKSTTPEFRPARLHTVVEQQTPTEPERPQIAPSAQSEESDANLPPNVYINGLPPHFPETELYALAAPFGEVRSVRSFTRHVGERESGYGFVLFAKLDSAERCIQSLRRYRNLHPTFSKQVHKIPGTPYAAPKPYPTPQAGIGHEQFGDDPNDVSFKEKMERLHDFTSTNLYIEGLPLSIDEPTLSALVAPHQIKSSRFFQTKLSNPPRIIAFVRLETRAGAEEVIERLHGRMVRGWNDTGSRISVRFADTAEQRELRRQERNARDGEQSASRLTIAQAALLNLRGPAMSAPPSHTSLSSFPSHTSLSSLPSHGVLPSQRRQPRGPVDESNFVHGNHGLAVDYNLQRKSPNPYQQRKSPNPHQYDHRSGGQPTFRTSSEEQHIQLPPPQREASNGSMAHLLDSLRSSGLTQNGSRFDYREQFPQTLRSSSSSTDLLSAAAAYSNQHPFPESRAAQARNGYTPAEEYLLQQANGDTYPERERDREHSALRRRLPASRISSDGKEGTGQGLNVGVRGYRAQASTMAFPLRSPALNTDFSPSLSEDDFHSSSARRGYHASHASYSDDETPHYNPQAHIRSSTLPHPPTGVGRQRHAQHSSISITPSSRSQFGIVPRKNADRYGDSSPALTQHSPSLVSPSLTYSSRTPATLSPATPFFNTFAGDRDGFDGGLIGEKHSQQLSSRAPAIAAHRDQA